MSVNKVVISNETKLDLTADTVDAAHLAKGYTAHNKKGEAITGTMESGSSGSGAWIEGDWTYWGSTAISTWSPYMRTSVQSKSKLHGFSTFPTGVYFNSAINTTTSGGRNYSKVMKNASMGVEVDCSDCPDMSQLPAWSITNCAIQKFVASPLTNIGQYAIGVNHQPASSRPSKVFDFRLCTVVPNLTAADGFCVVRDNDITTTFGLYDAGYINTLTIVVPDSLYDEWIAKTNWVRYASAIIKASEYTEETT